MKSRQKVNRMCKHRELERVEWKIASMNIWTKRTLRVEVC